MEATPLRSRPRRLRLVERLNLAYLDRVMLAAHRSG